MARKPRRKKALTVAHEIARRLQRRGIHGRFTVERFKVDDTDWQPEKGSDFFWLKSANPDWIEFRVSFNRRSRQEIEAIGDIARAFMEPLIKAGYSGRSIAMVKTSIGEDEEDTYDDWRSLTVTLKARATLGQLGDATRRWINKPEYQAATGIAIRIEL